MGVAPVGMTSVGMAPVPVAAVRMIVSGQELFPQKAK